MEGHHVEVSHVLFALLGLVAMGAVVVGTMVLQRQARTDRRLDQLEDELGVTPDEHPAEGRRPHKDTVRARVRGLEVRTTVIGSQIATLKKRVGLKK